MRVAYFTNTYPAVSHTFVRRELLALERLGVEVRRIALRADPPARLVDAEDRAERDRTTVLLEFSRVALIAKLARAMMRRPFAALGVLGWALRLARRSAIRRAKMLAYWAEALLLVEETRGADLVRVHFGTNGAVVARLARRLGAPPFAIAYHGPDEFDAPERWDLRGTIAEAAFVNAISHYGTAQLMRWSDVADWPRIGLVRCAVDRRFFDAPPLPPGPLRLCAVGRLAPQKGFALLIDALGDLKDADGDVPTLDIVGEGPLRAALTAQVAARGLADHVRFLGARDGAGVRAVLAECHIFVLPSFAEGLPVVIMEALASGRPVLASAIAGTPELVRPGRNGWLVAAGDRAGLVETLRSAIATPPDDLAAMGENGRRDVAERHVEEAAGQSLLALAARFAAG